MTQVWDGCDLPVPRSSVAAGALPGEAQSAKGGGGVLGLWGGHITSCSPCSGTCPYLQKIPGVRPSEDGRSPVCLCPRPSLRLSSHRWKHGLPLSRRVPSQRGAPSSQSLEEQAGQSGSYFRAVLRYSSRLGLCAQVSVPATWVVHLPDVLWAFQACSV